MKLLILAVLFYFIWKLMRFGKIISNNSKKSKKIDPYNKFDIKDADFEDIKDKK